MFIVSSRSATILVIFTVACIAFLVATVFASMTGPISIIPTGNNSSGISNNLSTVAGPSDNYKSSSYDNSKDYSSSSSYSSDKSSKSQVETTVDDSSGKQPSSTQDDSKKPTSGDSDTKKSSDSKVVTYTDSSGKLYFSFFSFFLKI